MEIILSKHAYLFFNVCSKLRPIMSEERQRLGVIQDLTEAPIPEEERIRIIQEYLPVRLAFENFLRKGKQTKYSILDRLVFRPDGHASWHRSDQVNTPLGPVGLHIETSVHDGGWSKAAHDIPNARIKVLLIKENDTKEGIEENSAYFELYPIWAAEDEFESYADLKEVKNVTERLKPLVDLMRAQNLA